MPVHSVLTWCRPGTGRIRLPAYPATVPMMSDIELLLPSSAKSGIDINGMKAIVSPFDELPRRNTLYIYWQMYNLTKDADGKTGYRSRVLLTPGESGPGDESVVAYDNTHAGRDESEGELGKHRRSCVQHRRVHAHGGGDRQENGTHIFPVPARPAHGRLKSHQTLDRVICASYRDTRMCRIRQDDAPCPAHRMVAPPGEVRRGLYRPRRRAAGERPRRRRATTWRCS